MVRPCLLVIDREYSGAISTRKLVIETAKFNVITAYSGREALDTFERFAAVHAVILNASIPDMPCSEVVNFIRERAPRMPIITIQGPGAPDCPGTDHLLDSFDPAALLELLRKLFPAASKAIKQHDDALKAEENLN